VAPAAASVRVTVGGCVKVPEGSENAGGAAGRKRVKTPLEMALVLKPGAVAMALIVVVEEMLIGEEYGVDPVVGFVPSRV
jgi:tetrahydromethanopterin S-methyltransferase subunit D